MGRVCRFGSMGVACLIARTAPAQLECHDRVSVYLLTRLLRVPRLCCRLQNGIRILVRDCSGSSPESTSSSPRMLAKRKRKG